jgi:hypothetical protein
MDVTVAKRSDGAEMHVTGYFDNGWAKGYLLVDDEPMPIRVPLYSLIRNDADDWTPIPAALEKVPLHKDERKRSEWVAEEAKAAEKTNPNRTYTRVVIKNEQ